MKIAITGFHFPSWPILVYAESRPDPGSPGKSIHEVDVAALKKNGGQRGSRVVSRDDFMHGAEELEIPLLRQIFVVEFACGLGIKRLRAWSGLL
jgi:hypothetical protein